MSGSWAGPLRQGATPPPTPAGEEQWEGTARAPAQGKETMLGGPGLCLRHLPIPGLVTQEVLGNFVTGMDGRWLDERNGWTWG